MAIYIDDALFQPKPADLKGEGGVAEVYAWSGGVVKLYKQPEHPAFALLPPLQRDAAQAAARARLRQMQDKLPAFPKVPPGIVAPGRFAYNSKTASKRLIVGYTMPFIDGAVSLREFAQREYREKGGITQEDVVGRFLALHDTLMRAHDSGLVIGDFNPFNGLVTSDDVKVIDADSMQFGAFQCVEFTPRYVDPLICKPGSRKHEMIKFHSELTDWYAFAIIFFECLLYVHPYGGVHKPKLAKDRIGPDERPLRRVSVFNPEVNYPTAGIPYATLPDTVLDWYRGLLERDVREPFPRHFLEALRFGPGSVAKLAFVPRADQASELITAGAKSTKLFDVVAPGVILQAVVQDGQLRYLYHRDGAFFREGGNEVLKGKLDPSMRFRIQGEASLVSKGKRTFFLAPGQTPVSMTVDQYRSQFSVFDANADDYFWVGGGQIWRNGASSPKLLTDTVENQTRLWAGPTFGFACYQAGEYRRAFLFDAESGLKRDVDIAVIAGKIVDISCSFTAERLWLFVTEQRQGQLINRAVVIARDGTVIASTEEEDGSTNWLGSLQGKTAAGLPLASGGTVEVLFSQSDDGIVQVQADGARLVVKRTFVGTASLVQQGDSLLFSKAGLYSWNTQQIRVITTSRT